MNTLMFHRATQKTYYYMEIVGYTITITWKLYSMRAYLLGIKLSKFEQEEFSYPQLV